MTHALPESQSQFTQRKCRRMVIPVFLIDTPPVSNAELTLQKAVHVFFVDGRHRHESIFELCSYNCPMFYWHRNTLPVYLSLRSNSLAFSNTDIMKNSKSYNIAFSTMIPYTELLPILRSAVAYARTFNEK